MLLILGLVLIFRYNKEIGRLIMKHGMLWLTFLFAQSVSAQVPQEWHTPPNRDELMQLSLIVRELKQAPDLPAIKKWHLFHEARPDWQINAWERDMQIYLPIEMFRFIWPPEEGTPGPSRMAREEIAFLLAHEAGHAKQEEVYKTSCYEAKNVQMDKYDHLRSLADILGAASTNGLKGLELSQENKQKQICEDHADAWAVRFTREAGFDPSGGIRLFTKMSQAFGRPGWKGLTQQFISAHSVDAVRIAHISLMIQTKKQF